MYFSALVISFLCFTALAEACAVSFVAVSVALSAKIEAVIEKEINSPINHIKKTVFLNEANIVDVVWEIVKTVLIIIIEDLP